MRKRYLALGAALALLVAAVSGYVLNGTQLYQRYHLTYSNYQFVPTGPCGALIAWTPPSTLYAGLYINQPRLLTLRYRSSAPQTLRISISIPSVTQEESVEVQAARAFQSRDFRPPLLGGSAKESAVASGQRQGQIRLHVRGDGGDCDVTTPLLVKSRQWMRWYDSATNENNIPYLAGWVTPDAPAVQPLIGRAASELAQRPAAYPGTTALVGYGAGTVSAQTVRGQVNALFDTLQ